MLPRQPCLRSGACHVVDPAGNKDAVCARHDHGFGRQWEMFFEIGSSLPPGYRYGSEEALITYRRCHHVLGWLPCPLVMRVLRSLECGSHAAAPAVLTIWRVSRG
ncbi:MAG: hypothetical protein KatS3mg056_1546 [Chloroflexus sp.]|nr:MAG: hypothetical protein KatS3mg056_1546 [Chloroflexus sp.]